MPPRFGVCAGTPAAGATATAPPTTTAASTSNGRLTTRFLLDLLDRPPLRDLPHVTIRSERELKAWRVSSSGARTVTHTDPSPAATRCGSLPIPIVATTSPVSGSMRVRERPSLFATQTAPSPTATSTGPSPTSTVVSVGVWPGPGDGDSRHGVILEVGHPEVARPHGDRCRSLPTVISRCFWLVSGSTSTTEFAARFTTHSEPSPKATSENAGSTELDDVSRPASSPIDVAAPVRASTRPRSPTSHANQANPPPKVTLARGAPHGVFLPEPRSGSPLRSVRG